jgi:hypothetical protein
LPVEPGEVPEYKNVSGAVENVLHGRHVLAGPGGVSPTIRSHCLRPTCGFLLMLGAIDRLILEIAGLSW